MPIVDGQPRCVTPSAIPRGTIVTLLDRVRRVGAARSAAHWPAVVDVRSTRFGLIANRPRLERRSDGPSAAIVPSTVGLAGSVGAIDGPPPPVAPAVIARDTVGRATVRAVRLTAPLRLDGALDENVYRVVPSMSNFIQTEPNEGEPATEKTEAWVLFDDDTVYVSARAWDSAPESEWIVNEMRRDSTNLLRNEGVHISFDTFYDRRNNVTFQRESDRRTDGRPVNK